MSSRDFVKLKILFKKKIFTTKLYYCEIFAI